MQMHVQTKVIKSQLYKIQAKSNKSALIRTQQVPPSVKPENEFGKEKNILVL